MPSQITLSWSVSSLGTSRSPAQATAALGAVKLYDNPFTDPVLGQFFGLTIATDITIQTATGATRTLTFNMTTAAGAPLAPPFFPCRPQTSTPPVPPYPLFAIEPLEGAFLTVPGSTAVKTSIAQTATLNPNQTLQFIAQPGVLYQVSTVAPTQITLMTPFTGDATANQGAIAMVPAPAKLAAIYSTSPVDTAGTPSLDQPILPGSGAQSVSISYLDSTGAGPFTVVVPMQGRLPTAVPLAGGSIDIAVITDMHVASTGGFQNSVGQITLVEVSALPDFVLVTPLPPNRNTRVGFEQLTDKRQTLITRHLAYMPLSFFAIAEPQQAMPLELEGDFIVTSGSASVPTTSDQTGVLAPNNVILFASQLELNTPYGTVPVLYTVKAVTPKLVTLTSVYTGLDFSHRPERPEWSATKGTVSDEALNLPTAAFLVQPSSAAPPTNAALAGPLAQSVTPGTAVPPPNPPQADQPVNPVGNLGRPGGATSGIDDRPQAPPRPATMSPSATLLSDLFTHTLRLALAGASITPAPIVVT